MVRTGGDIKGIGVVVGFLWFSGGWGHLGALWGLGGDGGV